MKKLFIFLLFFFTSIFLRISPALAITINVTSGDSIQTKCLNIVKPGDTCIINQGTYNISSPLTIVTSGTSSAPITLKCAIDKGCTVNSDLSRSLITNGEKKYYTIDGFRFISTLVDNSHPGKMGTVNFGYDFWGDGYKAERGNDGFILRNCYVEGAVYFYGSDNIIENCEFNGRNIFSNGIIEAYEPSENNIFRNNIIHDYTQRGGWTLQLTDNSLWENNTIYNIGNNGEGNAIDCDGAGWAVSGCNMRKNKIYNMANAETAILLENTFNSVIEENTIFDVSLAISVINYDKDNFPDPFQSNEDYTGLPLQTTIKNNLIYNISEVALLCKGTKGGSFINNTIHNIQVARGYWAAIALADYYGPDCPEWIVKNNIISKAKVSWWLEGDSATGTAIDYNFYSSFSSANPNVSFSTWQTMGYDKNSKNGVDPNFINPSAGDFRLQSNSPACGFGAFSCNISNSLSTVKIESTSIPTITLIPTLTPTSNLIIGDANGDGKVNDIDYPYWNNNYGKILTGSVNGDFNNNNIVDGVDYVLWLNNHE